MPVERRAKTGSVVATRKRVYSCFVDMFVDSSGLLRGRDAVLWTIIVILLILWLLGGFVRPVGGFIHVLLVIVLILVVLQLL